MFQPAEALALAAQKHTRREQASSQKTFAETSDIASQYAGCYAVTYAGAAARGFSSHLACEALESRTTR